MPPDVFAIGTVIYLITGCCIGLHGGVMQCMLHVPYELPKMQRIPEFWNTKGPKGSGLGSCGLQKFFSHEVLKAQFEKNLPQQSSFNYFCGQCQHLNLFKVKVAFNSLRIFTPRLLKLSMCIWTCPVCLNLIDLLQGDSLDLSLLFAMW